jgi:hypothetical protein
MPKLSTPNDLERWCDFLRGLKLPLEVTQKPWKPARRLEANAYLWKFVYGPVVEELGFTEEAWHEYQCIRFFGGKQVEKPDGTTETRPIRTTTKDENGERDVLKGDRFNDFLVSAEQFFATKGIYIERGPL